jgi:peptide/nickel transport system substrate-binding protein
MKKDRLLGAVVLGTLALVLLLLVVVLVQLHRVEKRFIAQGQQLRALGDATDRLMAGGVRAASTGAIPTEDAIPPGVTIRHPEVENFLKKRDITWPAPGANLDGTIHRGWATGDPKGFNPLLENSAYNGTYLELYAGQSAATPNVFTNPDVWYGDLAFRVEVTDDYKRFTIYVKPGHLWHRPAGVNLEDPRYAWLKKDQPVTAHDFVFTLDMILNPQVESGPARNYYQELYTWKALDEHTLELVWKKKQFTNLEQSLALMPLPKFLYTVDQGGKPFPKETLGLRFNQHWYNNKAYVGSGPYRMASYEPGSKITLVRNDQFPGPKPAVKAFDYPVYTDPQQTLLKLKAHELNVGELMPGQYYEEIQRFEEKGEKPKNSPFFDGRIVCDKVPDTGYRYLAWNADRPIFSDKRVRNAMTYAFDRPGILAKVFRGLGTLTTGPFSPDGPYSDPSIKPRPVDLEAAKRLLADAGWSDSDGDGLLDKALRPGEPRKPFAFNFLVPATSTEALVLANILRDDLLKIGVKMTMESAEWSLFLKRMDEKNFDAYVAAWTTGWQPDLFQIWHSTQADVPKGSNRVGFRNKEADRIIEALRNTFEIDQRIALAREFHRLVDVEQPYTFFFFKNAVICHWAEVKDVKYSKVYPTTNMFPWSVARTAP